MSLYTQQLDDPRWEERRLHILKRDKHSCSKCANTADNSKLDVHHRYYLMGRMAWEYDDIVLITLCEKCHNIEEEALKEQSLKIIEVFKQSGATSEQLSELKYYLVRIFDCEKVIQILHDSVEDEYRSSHPINMK